MSLNKAVYFDPLTDRETWLADQVVDIAFAIHRALGPGLLESVYEKCFCFELSNRGILFQRQRGVPIFYEGLLIDEGLKIDILIDDLVVVELKAQETYHPVWEAQLLTYLKLSKKRLGYLINFHVPLIKDGIKRRII
jgi:GxxExxY protein